METLAAALAGARAGRQLALATVIGVTGSVPRHLGAHMAVDTDGRLIGTIGGGRIEVEVVRAAAHIAAGAPARRLRHHLVRDLAMCCGGSMELYIEPLSPSVPAIERALALRAARRPAALVTPLDGGAKSIDELGSFGARRPHVDGERFIEPVWPPDRLILFGAGHVAAAIGPLAARVGFEVVACDDDDTGALEPVPAWAHTIVESFEVRDVVRTLGPLGAGDYAIILTRDHAIDQRILETLIGADELTYLGMIGSRGKVGRFRKRLAAKGLFDETRWQRLRAPVGLDIGAETPEEISVAVVAELIAVRRQAIRG